MATEQVFIPEGQINKEQFVIVPLPVVLPALQCHLAPLC